MIGGKRHIYKDLTFVMRLKYVSFCVEYEGAILAN